MDYIFGRILCLLITPLILSTILLGVRKKKHEKEGEVHLPLAFLIIGIIASLTCLIPAVITAFSERSPWLPLALLLCSLVGSVLIVGFINCRISYDDSGFVYKNLFGVKHSITYDQVTAIKEHVHETYIYMDNRRVMVDEYSVGGATFIDTVKGKYQDLHDGKTLPHIQKTKGDLFNGNIRDTSSFVIVFIIGSIGFLGMLLNFTILHNTVYTAENTTEKIVVFNAYTLSDGDLFLFSEYNDAYLIRSVDQVMSEQEIDALCRESKVYTVYAKPSTSSKSTFDYEVKALAYGDQYLLSFDETQQVSRSTSSVFLILAGVLCVLWLLYIIGAIVVGRNPQKHSLAVVRIFFNHRQYPG